jgi:hypothetical protein
MTPAASENSPPPNSSARAYMARRQAYSSWASASAGRVAAALLAGA